MTSTSGVSQAIETLAKSFSGSLLRPGEAGYDEARKVHNGLIDKHPAVIARCRGAADVADAMKFGREAGLEIAVRGGGHNVAGKATVEGGLMIDLAQMTGVHVDPKTRTARAQGGVTWGLYNRETQVHGLASTGGLISTTGIGGLTLGGGVGWLMSKHGLALDNLLSVQLVTADGKLITASQSENPDLFWGLRGGGGNFGIATALEYKLHPVGPMVTGGLAAHPFPKAREVMRFFRDFGGSLPDEMSTLAALTHAPDGSGMSVAAMAAAHFGSLAEGEKAVKPVKAFGPPVMDAIGPMPYSALNSMLDAGYPKGALNYWKSNFLAELSDQAIDTMIDCFSRCPTPMGAMVLEHFHGAVTRVPVSETAFPHRSPGYNMLILGQWMDPKDNVRCVSWARESYELMRPFMGKGRYVNYMGDDEATDAVAAAYGPNYARLRELKAKYDPGNVFHLNQNIRP
ncbi:MAG: FAD-binding oxidoreductase [Rhizobiales bacterium]|nr:FAD-binding oxidoreductase [Hyphomicrobiales bacterium]MBI3672420.1 FAD-binding oxidoreductase [Hyphomicrobiales bacterium]